jgi:hypothetical protein
MTSEQIIDCHAHIIDPARFPFGAMETPRPLHRRVPDTGSATATGDAIL